MPAHCGGLGVAICARLVFVKCQEVSGDARVPASLGALRPRCLRAFRQAHQLSPTTPQTRTSGGWCAVLSGCGDEESRHWRAHRALHHHRRRAAPYHVDEGANNFTDLSSSPLLSRVLGFCEAEIRSNFPGELRRLADALGVDVDGAVAELARRYGGYCFDGATSSFSPFLVLKSLREGAITERMLAAASHTKWPGLKSDAVFARRASELWTTSAEGASWRPIADFDAERVRAVPLLLQTGLLSLVAGRPQRGCPPNAYARRSLQVLVANALAAAPAALASLGAALRARDHAAFSAVVPRVFASTAPRVSDPQDGILPREEVLRRPRRGADRVRPTRHCSAAGEAPLPRRRRLHCCRVRRQP